MSLKNLLCFIPMLFILSFSLTAQLTNGQKSILSIEILHHINELRENEGFDKLTLDPKIKKPAENHSQYMATKKILAHEQDNEDLSTPFKRFYHFNCKEYGLVGENVLKSYLDIIGLTEEDLKLIAKEMFESWKNSPGHYANMIHEYYEQTNFGFAFNKEEKMIYATNVFAKKGTRIEGQLSDNSFNIKSERNCNENLHHFNNIIANLGNDISIEGDKVTLYYHSKKYFNEFLPNNKSGFAIDLISKDQFNCKEKNQLDISPIYDGIMLKPIFKNEIVENNRAQSDYRIISDVGNIPDNLRDKPLAASLLLIQNETRCKYIVPGKVQRKAYKLRNINPILLNPINTTLKNKGLISSKIINYEFETNKTNILKVSEIDEKITSLHSIEINSFSSVEGPTERNNSLHSKRAESIKKHLKKLIPHSEKNIQVNSKENWDEMEYQFKYYFLDSLLDFSRDSIKQIIKSNTIDIPWDSLLHAQRKSNAIIMHYISAIDTNKTTELITLNLKTAIINKDFQLANKALCIIFNNPSLSNIILDELIFEGLLEHKELVQNASPILMNFRGFSQLQPTRFLSKWVLRIDELDNDAKQNLLQLYAVVNNDLVKNWDLPSQSLANVIHPKRIKDVYNISLKTDLALNLHITFINYFGQINDSNGTNESFNYISNHFKSKIHTPKDELDLVLFYNYWSRYDLTLSNLYPKLYKNEITEEALFILLETSIFYPQLGNDDIIDIHKKALKTNKDRWCLYVDNQFQILRDTEVKKLFCESCPRNLGHN